MEGKGWEEREEEGGGTGAGGGRRGKEGEGSKEREEFKRGITGEREASGEGGIEEGERGRRG